MRCEVLLTAGAVQDLEEIVAWIAAHDAPVKASAVLDRIEAAIRALARFPERGAYPRELLALGMRDYRETLFKPYRIIHRVQSQHVYVYLVADGRRDMQSLLARRLLGN